MCTGNIKSINSDKYSDAVYPCMYREHSSVMSNGKRKYGLSLYVQGTLFIKSLNPIFSRFIPVYTGNAFPQLQSPEFYPVYPCVYRERQLIPSNSDNIFGLSLCIQGTQVLPNAGNVTGRFIPVYTGNAPIITYCFIFKILTAKFLPIFWDIFH